MNIDNLLKRILAFRDARDWKQFHKPNHLAAGISIEAGELLEHFLWKTPEQVSELKQDKSKNTAIGEEIADVLIYGLLLAHEMDLDPSTIIQDKLSKNAAKYPISKSKGSAAKYNEFK